MERRFGLAKTGAGHALLSARLPPVVCGPRGDVRPLVIDDLPWKVFEYVDNREQHAEVSLMFSCDSSWRRIRAFPPDWRDLDDAMLAEIGAGR
jgi:hypothetical protein